MSNRETPLEIKDDLVVSMAYVLKVDGELVDSTEEGESLQFIQGYGSIIPGLEKALYGMAEAERKIIRVYAKDAYGEYDPEQVIRIPMGEYPEDLDLEPDLVLEMKDKDGDTIYARVVSVGKSRVKMDFNHPLAGQDLDFDIAILALRKATAEELEQGFVE